MARLRISPTGSWASMQLGSTRRRWPSGQSIMCCRFSKRGEKKKKGKAAERPKGQRQSYSTRSRSLLPVQYDERMLRSVGARPYTRRTTDVSGRTKRQEPPLICVRFNVFTAAVKDVLPPTTVQMVTAAVKNGYGGTSATALVVRD